MPKGTWAREEAHTHPVTSTPLLDTSARLMDIEVWTCVFQLGKRATLCFHTTVKVSVRQRGRRRDRMHVGSRGEKSGLFHRPSRQTRESGLLALPRAALQGVSQHLARIPSWRPRHPASRGGSPGAQLPVLQGQPPSHLPLEGSFPGSLADLDAL